MSPSSEIISQLTASIVNDSFPESTELLEADIEGQSIPQLLHSITESRQAAAKEIAATSKDQASNVDEWIAQAKKVQGAIARCKIEASQIVEEHYKTEQLRNNAQDTKAKVALLEAEILFNKALEHELENVDDIYRLLGEAEDDLQANRVNSSAQKLSSAGTAIDHVCSGTSQSLLRRYETDLRQRIRFSLQSKLDSGWIAEHRSGEIHLICSLDTKQSSELVDGFSQLAALPDAIDIMTKKVDKFLLQTFLVRHMPRIASSKVQGRQLVIGLRQTDHDVLAVLDAFKASLNFLHDNLPTQLADQTMQKVLPRVVENVTTKCLNHAIPFEVDEFDRLSVINTLALECVQVLSNYSWPGHEELELWIEQVPRLWLAKRQGRSLDTVRKAYAAGEDSSRSVERVERQVVRRHDSQNPLAQAEPDAEGWNADWSDEEDTSDSKPEAISTDIDEVSGWGFEENEGVVDPIPDPEEQDDKDTEAWGWGDESPTVEKQVTLQNSDTIQDSRSNGTRPALRQPPEGEGEEEELVLTETYNITGIPDHVLEVVGKDFLDSSSLLSSPASQFLPGSMVAELKLIPDTVLAMFRATAPVAYAISPTLSNMHLYNDTIYVTAVLRSNPDPAVVKSLESACAAMDKFARQTYTRELELQRTILSDLLDGAQGFVSCSKPPYSQSCDGAVAAVLDRVRQVRTEWKSVLGQSHLLQSIGGLVAMVMGKIIQDVEDMDDISEADSKKLVEHCQHVSSLEDLFPATTMADAGLPNKRDEQVISAIALYVPNFIRFQYLQQILESSLADIRYLWTEGELSLEFQADEVVDLINALFSESSYRRSAIQAIKTSK